MQHIYAMAEVKWLVPECKHEDWAAHKGRLCRPARFVDQDDAYCELCFALSQAVYYGDVFIVPVSTLSRKNEERLAVGAVFEVSPDGKTAVAIGKIISVHALEEGEFRHVFRASESY